MATRVRRLLALASAALLVVTGLWTIGPCGEGSDGPDRAPADPADDGGQSSPVRARARASGETGEPGADDSTAESEDDATTDGSAWCGPGRQARRPDTWAGTIDVAVRRADTGDAIPGATVLSFPSAHEPPREVVTGADGTAAVPAWSGGGRVLVRRRGFIPEWGDESVRAGAKIEVALDPGAIVEGRVTRAADGSPVAGARLAVWPGDWHDGWDGIVVSAADGTFEFCGVPPDAQATVIARAPGFAPRSVVSRPGEPRERIEFLLGVGGVISGHVRDAEGRPVADADVQLVAAGAPQPELLHFRGVGPLRRATRAEAEAHERDRTACGDAHETLRQPATRTDADGRFEIAGLDLPSRWDVYAWLELPPGPRPAPTDGAEPEDPPPVRFAEGRALRVEAASPGAQAASADIVVGPLAVIRVTILTADGEPAGPRDCAASLDGEWHEVPQTHRGRPEEDGIVEFERVYAGPHVVHVDSKTALDTRVPVTVTAGEAATVTVRLDRGGTIRGRVTDDRGVPVPGASAGFSGPGDAWRSAECGADGTFEITGVPDGEGDVSASAIGHARVERASVRAGSDVGTLVLVRDAKFVGRVPVGAGGTELSFSVSDAGGCSWSGGIEVAADGSFGFEDTDCIPAGVAVEITIWTTGRAPFLLRDVVLAPGEVKDLGTIEFPAGVTLRGTIVDAGGAPVRGAVIDCAESWSEGSVTSRADGSFEVPHLVPVRCLFVVTAEGFPRTWVEITPHEDERPQIRLSRGGVLRGRLEGAALAAFRPGDHLDAYPLDAAGTPDSSRYQEIAVGSAGTFEARLPAGRFLVGFHRMREPTVPQTVTISPDEPAEIVLRGP